MERQQIGKGKKKEREEKCDKSGERRGGRRLMSEKARERHREARARGIGREKAVLSDMIKRTHVKGLKGEDVRQDTTFLAARGGEKAKKKKWREQEKSVKHNLKLRSSFGLPL